jgi:hypothetical protein
VAKLEDMARSLSGVGDNLANKFKQVADHLERGYRAVAGISGASYAQGGDVSVGYAGGTGMRPPTFSGSPNPPTFGGGGFGGGAARAGITAAGALMTTLPGANTAITQDAITNRTRFFMGLGPGGNQDVLAMQRQLNASGLPTNRLDATNALLESQRYGFAGLNNFGELAQGAAFISNLTPGVGITGGMQAMGQMNQARAVNMARMMGIRIQDPMTGAPKPPEEVAEQFYQQVLKANNGKTPSRDELATGLMPGRSISYALDSIYGSDEMAKTFIKNYIMQKATGKGFTTEGLIQSGAMTDATKNLGAMQGALGNITGTTGGALSGAVGIGAQLRGGLTSVFDAFLRMLPGLKDGGSAKEGKPYVVGEEGPELFVPEESGTVIPNGKSKNLRAILQNAGFSGDDLEIAQAVVMAESGGNTKAFNPKGRDLSYGLFQINMKDDDPKNPLMGQKRREKFNIENEDLFDPYINAKVAYQISSKGSKWTPWSTYNSGAYKKFLGKDVVLKDSGGSSNYSSDSQFTTSSADGDFGSGAFGGGANPFVGSSRINYGGVNVTINTNGANVTAADIIRELKRQLGYEQIMSIIGAS